MYVLRLRGREGGMMDERVYIAIDLKSFYASVECRARGRDPFTTNLVVADASRTDKTICLAVSPALKAYGIPGRPRLFEVKQAVKEINRSRLRALNGKAFKGKSDDIEELRKNPALELDFIAARPQMKKYEEISASIYAVYLRYIAPEDIHVYSIDEVFMDVTGYLKIYGLTARELAVKMIHEVLEETGITATAGIAPNLYLCKAAMDIVAKHISADKDGVRIAEIDEMSYRRILWNHRPLTDFWRVGTGYAKKLESKGIFTMGDIARSALENEEMLFKMFGVNAEYLIDHAFGIENTTIADIKAYKPQSTSTGAGQVLSQPYTVEKTRIIIREMAETLAMDLLSKGLVTDQIVITVGYDIENLKNPSAMQNYKGVIKTDHYGRKVPKSAHGSINLDRWTNSVKKIVDASVELFDSIIESELLTRRVYITANHTKYEKDVKDEPKYEQLDLFTDYGALETERKKEEKALEREKRMQLATLELRKKFGKNAVLRGTDLQDGANTIERNKQIGGHKA